MLRRWSVGVEDASAGRTTIHHFLREQGAQAYFLFLLAEGANFGSAPRRGSRDRHWSVYTQVTIPEPTDERFGGGTDDFVKPLGGKRGGTVRAFEVFNVKRWEWLCADCEASGSTPAESSAALMLYNHRRAVHFGGGTDGT